MSKEDQPQKYSYRYSLQAKPALQTVREESGQAELQRYINEILGVRKAKPDNTLTV